MFDFKSYGGKMKKVLKVDGGGGCTKHANILNATELYMV